MSAFSPTHKTSRGNPPLGDERQAWALIIGTN